MLETPSIHYAQDDYREKLLESINHAEDRVLLETMVLNHLEGMEEVLEACLHARKRGAAVLMVYDDTFTHPSIIGKNGLRAFNDFQERMKQLEQEGIIIHKVGNKEINPFAGRHHAKAVVVDDHAYVGGGVNLTGDSFETHDYMLRIDHKELADALFDALPDAATMRPDDQILFKSDTTEVLLDGGAKKNSIIYERTCERAAEAERVYYVSKLAPDGQLLDILKQKDDVQYWFNTIKSAASFDKLAIAIDQTKARLDNLYHGNEILHAKFCVFEMPDGSLEAVAGSHNFNSRGVEFGTQEIALHTKDQALCRQLIEFAEALGTITTDLSE